MNTCFSIFFIVIIVEIISSSSWQPFYFTIGIPIYRKSAMISVQRKYSPEELNRYFSKETSHPLLFKQISEDQIAFREALLSGSFTSKPPPVMRGLIQYDEDKVQVFGLVNWSIPTLIIVFIAGIINLIGPFAINLLLLALPIGFIVGVYFVQLKQFNRVYAILTGSSNRGKI